MAQFKMRDKVILKKDLVVGEVYGGLTLYPEMAKFNEVFTIDTIANGQNCHYGVEGIGYFFAEEMLELYTTSNTSQLKINRSKKRLVFNFE